MEELRPSRVAAGIAAALPLVSLVAGGVVLLVAGEPFRMMQEAGAPGFVVVGSSVLAAIGAGILLACAGLGFRIPSAATVAVAAAPWALGAAGMMMGLAQAVDAISFADPATRASLMAQGFAEASNARLMGTVLGGALLAGTALGLGTTALGQRAPGRSLIGALVGAGTGLALLVAAGAAVKMGQLGGAAVLFVMPALAGVLALALAGAGAGADAPHGRAAALAAATPVAAGLAFLAGAAAASTHATIEVFRALAAVESGSRSSIIAQAAIEIAPAGALERWGAIAVLVPVLALALLALSRVRASTGKIAAGVALALVAALVVLLDLRAVGTARDDLASAVAVPWQSAPEFAPATFAGEPGGGPVDAVVGLGNVSTPSGVSAHLASAEAVRALFATLVPAAFAPRDIPTTPPAHASLDVLGQPDPTLARSPFDPQPLDGPVTPTLALAIDERLPAAALRSVLQAAQQAGARSVRVVGVAPGASAEELTRMRDQAPLLAAFAVEPRSRLVLLEGWLRPGEADGDGRLLHVRIGANTASVVLEPRVGGGDPVPLEGAHSRDLGGPQPGAHGELAYLALGPDADAGRFVQVADRAALAGLRPLAVLGDDFSGHPEQPPAVSGDELADALTGMGGLGSIGLGNLGARGVGTDIQPPLGIMNVLRAGSSPRVQAAAPDARGTMSPAVIQRVVRSHLAEVRYCYERELVQTPALAGRVTVSFVIGATGEVQSSRIASSTMDNSTLDRCIVEKVARWRFPSPDGGVVAVNYPFVFAPAE